MQFIFKPNQIILKPSQFILKPNQIILKPNQFILKPNQVILKPNQFILKPTIQFILKPTLYYAPPATSNTTTTTTTTTYKTTINKRLHLRYRYPQLSLLVATSIGLLFFSRVSYRSHIYKASVENKRTEQRTDNNPTKIVYY